METGLYDDLSAHYFECYSRDNSLSIAGHWSSHGYDNATDAGGD